MDIQKSLDNAALTLTLTGRPDTVAAPAPSAVIENELAGVNS